MKEARDANANTVPPSAEKPIESTVEFRVPTAGRADTPSTSAVVLCIGGTDPSGGAGLPADARAVAAMGAIPLCVVSSVVAQNTRGVAGSEAVASGLFQLQLDNLLEDVFPDAMKVGLLPKCEHVEIVARIGDRLGIPLVVDPVFAPSGGAAFCDEETVEAYRELLLPRAELVTPNRAEAETLCGFAIANEADVRRAAHFIRNNFGVRAVLIKGGHFTGEDATDFLLTEDGETVLRAARLPFEVRGTGCHLAAAIAAGRAQNIKMEEAAARAKSWLHEAMKNSVCIGKGRRVTTQ